MLVIALYEKFSLLSEKISKKQYMYIYSVGTNNIFTCVSIKYFFNKKIYVFLKFLLRKYLFI